MTDKWLFDGRHGQDKRSLRFRSTGFTLVLVLVLTLVCLSVLVQMAIRESFSEESYIDGYPWLLSSGNRMLATSSAVPPDIDSSVHIMQQQQPYKKYEMHFLNHTQLDLNDGFSATWLQRRSDFMDMDFDTIHTCEDAAFRAFDKLRRNKMIMTLDYLDFSVEHMSKWWKILLKNDPWDGHHIPLAKIKQQFQTYIHSYHLMPSGSIRQTVFQNTLAVIAFQTYRHGGNRHNATIEASYNELTTLSLAATIESLRRAGFGRVVVSGTGNVGSPDYHLTQDAFWYLSTSVDDGATAFHNNSINQMIGHMQVGYAVASANHTRTSSIAKNIPKAAILGLRDAFRYAAENDLLQNKNSNASNDTSVQNKNNMEAWLGTQQDPSYWKYVYLTEPDSILQTRPSALPGLAAQVDQGYVMLPHRLQPIPHESDVPGMDKVQGRFVHEEDFPNAQIVQLDTMHDACCDENKGPTYKPGRPPAMDAGTCQHFFYACGFLKAAETEADRHRRLRPYGLMRLSSPGGTGIASLAGTVHGRRCIPKKNGVCRP